MLREWLAPMSVAEFERTVLGKQPWASPGAAAPAVPLCTWQRLGNVLAREPAPDVLVVAKGSLVRNAAAPRSLSALRALMQLGVGICARRVEHHDSELAALAQSMSRDLPGQTHVQLFATPGGTYGFSWHYDFEDVFIVQTAGIKDYYFRANTVEAHRPCGTMPDFAGVRRETSPVHTARLITGDCLYVPARWWHMARCTEDSLSISLGVLPARSVAGSNGAASPPSSRGIEPTLGTRGARSS